MTRCDELFQGPGDVRGVMDCFKGQAVTGCDDFFLYGRWCRGCDELF